MQCISNSKYHAEKKPDIVTIPDLGLVGRFMLWDGVLMLRGVLMFHDMATLGASSLLSL